jgi:bloom syndrome protein
MEDGRNEPFIPDSDGELLMPPSHNSSIAIASNSSQTAKATTEDSFNELPSKTLPESSQTSFLLNQLSSQPSTLTKWSKFMDKLIQQNDRNFKRAINERWPKEKRSEVKSEKERLLRQQKAFKQLTAPTDEYRALCRKREDLTQVITQAYAEGLDTDEDEVRLDDLTDEIQAVEQAILKTIDGTGLDVAGFLGTFQKPTHGRPPASVIVKGTQPMFQKEYQHVYDVGCCHTCKRAGYARGS